MQMSRWCWLVPLAMTSMRTAHAFSATLPRPWETPSKSSSHKNRQWKDVSLSAAMHDGDIRTAEEEEQGSLDKAQTSSSEEEGEEESMALEDSSSSRVFIAASSVADSAAVTSDPSSGNEPSKGTHETATVLSSWRLLWGMSRPSNFMGVVIFHVLGTYLGLRAKTETTKQVLLFSYLRMPQMAAVLLALLLTSATSMVVNDYYDFRAGIDASKTNKPLVNGQITPRVAKRYLSFLYATLLLTATVVPGIPARISIISGAILTFLYTLHLKPVTWLKNLTCAILISLAPVAAGAAALALSGEPASGILSVTPLWRLFSTLLFGFCGREMMMDINDVVDDRLHRVKTVPVRYGRQFASTAALVLTLAMSATSLVSASLTRQYILAGLGSLLQTRRALQVWWGGGENADMVTTAVDEGKTSVLLILASFV